MSKYTVTARVMHVYILTVDADDEHSAIRKAHIELNPNEEADTVEWSTDNWEAVPANGPDDGDQATAPRGFV